MFCLCRTCTGNYQQGPCEHNKSKRAIIGTWVTDELKEAISQGYVIETIYMKHRILTIYLNITPRQKQKEFLQITSIDFLGETTGERLAGMVCG